MTLFSHSKISSEGQRYGSKELIVHINGVLEKAQMHYTIGLDLGIPGDELKELLRIIVQYHDLGKYTSYFQNYLLEKPPIDGTLKQHARIGGFAAYNILRGIDEKRALIALYIIFLHHSYLVDIQQISKNLNDNLKYIINCQKKDLTKRLDRIQEDLNLEDPGKFISYPEEKPIRRAFKLWAIRNPCIQDYFLVNYLFSLLTEADKLDASDTIPYIPKRIDIDAVDQRFGKPGEIITQANLTDIQQFSNDELRNFCRSQVLQNLKNPAILDQYIFTLTAPTGIGKTMTALDFALKLKEKILQELKVVSRIIYALPFINIIEQAVREYEKTLPGEVKILAHYQYADIFGKEEKSNEDGSEPNYNQRLMAQDTWQADVIITSFVQFFETLIGNRNKLLKKFNHYANAIIILDEVQTLRLDQMPLIGTALFYLSRFLKARIILMTATKPKVFELAQEQILSKEGDEVAPLELLECYNDVFAFFERTKLVPLLDTSFGKETLAEDFVQKIFSAKWQVNKSCLIVCNTVKRSIEIHQTIKSFLKKNCLENRVEYLSTNIIPAHRAERIKRIKEAISSGQAPILISTQVVEAGVDLDFDMGFRDLGPIDSIIQVAGRINRNNNPKKKYSPLYVVDFEDAMKIYGRITYDQAKFAFQGQIEILESNYLNTIRKYFDDIADKKSFSQFNKIFESMKMLRYDSDAEVQDRPVSSFKIIEESRTTQAVFIEIDEYSTLLRSHYMARIKSEISKEEWERKYKQDFQKRIISIPGYMTAGLPTINEFDETLRVVPLDVLPQYYDFDTGFIRKNEKITMML